MNIINKTKIWLTISTILIIVSIILLAVFGLKLGIDFTGGSLLEVRYLEQRPEVKLVQGQLNVLDIGNITVQPVGEKNLILKFKDISEDKHQDMLRILYGQTLEWPEENAITTEAGIEEEDDNILKAEMVGGTAIITDSEISVESEQEEGRLVEELRFDSVGPSIGQELKRKSIYAIVIVLILIIAYIAWSFRKVSKPVASWKYGLAAIVALFHDVLIVVGVFALLGKYLGVEIDTAFIAAILTVLGYSVNDTIVVFDRLRENLPRSDEDFAGTVNTSLNQTIGRSINTSLTTLLVLLAIFIFGGETIKYFVLALIIGIIAGTYSSIFLASPLLVVWERWKK